MTTVPDQTPGADAGGAVLVPVGDSVTLRNTVSYAVAAVRESDDPVIHFVAPVPWDESGGASAEARADVEDLLERVAVWADEDAGSADVAVETAIVGADEYLFSPGDYADALAAYAGERGVERMIIDPEYSPGGNVPLLRPMEANLASRGFAVEEAPVETPIRRARFLQRSGLLQFATLFAISFLFYQLLGGFAIVAGDSYDLYYELATGVVTAAVVAGALNRVTLSRRPTPGRIARRTARLFLFVPYLLYEIVKSNVVITYIILHPRLPIEPRMTRVRAAVWGGPALTTLGNSITLTPGTLTVRTDGQDLYVHTLFASAREGLFEGGLERATRFLFYGRSAAAIATPEERDDTEVLQRPAGADTTSAEATDAGRSSRGDRSGDTRDAEDARDADGSTPTDRSADPPHEPDWEDDS